MRKISYYCFYAVLGLSFAQAVQANIPTTEIEPLLPQSSDVEQSLNQHPGVLAARSGLDYAAAYNQKIRLGDAAWTVKTGLQLRRTDAPDSGRSSETFYEPNIGLEKQVRLPNKARLDRDLGSREIVLAELKYTDAWHEASKELHGLWFAYLRALTQLDRQREQLQIIENQMGILSNRIRVGDAPRLELMLLNTEHLQSKEQLLQAEMNLSQTKQALSRYFQGNIPANFLTQRIKVLPQTYTQAQWVTAVLDANHELKLAQTQAQQQHALLQRQRLNSLPDPTLGVGYSREQAGADNLISFSVSIPLAQRQVRATTAMLEAEAKRADIEAARVQSGLVNETKLLSMQLQDAQLRMTKSEEIFTELLKQNSLMNKAYRLGEISLNELLLHSRQLIEGITRLDQARLDYAQNLSLLMLNSHMIWSIDDEH